MNTHTSHTQKKHRQRAGYAQCDTKTQRQSGMALIFVLLMLAVAIGVVVISARMSLSGGRASVNDRDRQIALQAAELALNDAEMDIMDAGITSEKTQGKAKGRGCKLGIPGNDVLRVAADEGTCGNKNSAEQHGLCKPAKGKSPYQLANWEAEEDDNTRDYVIFGEFTGRKDQLSTGSGITPAKAPRYIIVQYPSHQTFEPGLHKYKVYALGYGVNKHTQVMLESEITKHEEPSEKRCQLTSSSS